MAWRPCKCGVVLWAEVDHYWPGRRRSSDGMIGDPTHQAEGTGSDHNPNKDGVVLALDLSHDPGNFEAHAFADWLLEEIRAGREKRVKYLISNGRFSSASDGWQWVRYYGSDKHDTHIHVSFRPEPSLYDDDHMWVRGITDSGSSTPLNPADFGGALSEEDDVTPEQDEAIRATRDNLNMALGRIIALQEENRDEIRPGIAFVQSQVGALAGIVAKLASAGPGGTVDQAALEAAAEKGARAALDDLTLVAKEK